MKSLLTLDYELFFGSIVGTPQASIIDASNKLLTVLNEFNAKAVFFVDATYLLRLKEYAGSSSELSCDYDDVVSHIKYLEGEGHQIQLHIHPHWLDSFHDTVTWNIVADRYRLADWSKAEAAQIISDSITELNSHLENKVFAFRAGGWLNACPRPSPSVRAVPFTMSLRRPVRRWMSVRTASRARLPRLVLRSVSNRRFLGRTTRRISSPRQPPPRLWSCRARRWRRHSADIRRSRVAWNPSAPASRIR